MPRLVAALDADVLVPILSCDFLLTAFDLGLYEPVVSTEAIAEVERNLLADFPHLDPDSLRRRVGQMRDALEDHLVDPASLDDVPEDINPKDRHVIAAVLAGEASIVVTNDKRLRAEVAVTDLELVAMGADDFAAHLWQVGPDDVEAVITTLVAKRTTRPVTAHEMTAAMSGWFPTMSAAWSAASSGDVDR
jgi:predicted nucleic acid-binding protein